MLGVAEGQKPLKHVSRKPLKNVGVLEAPRESGDSGTILGNFHKEELRYIGKEVEASRTAEIEGSGAGWTPGTKRERERETDKGKTLKNMFWATKKTHTHTYIYI